MLKHLSYWVLLNRIFKFQIHVFPYFMSPTAFIVDSFFLLSYLPWLRSKQQIWFWYTSDVLTSIWWVGSKIDLTKMITNTPDFSNYAVKTLGGKVFMFLQQYVWSSVNDLPENLLYGLCVLSQKRTDVIIIVKDVNTLPLNSVCEMKWKYLWHI